MIYRARYFPFMGYGFLVSINLWCWVVVVSVQRVVNEWHVHCGPFAIAFWKLGKCSAAQEGKSE